MRILPPHSLGFLGRDQSVCRTGLRKGCLLSRRRQIPAGSRPEGRALRSVGTVVGRELLPSSLLPRQPRFSPHYLCLFVRDLLWLSRRILCGASSSLRPPQVFSAASALSFSAHYHL